MAGWNKVFAAALAAEAASGVFGVGGGAGLKVDEDLAVALNEEKVLIQAAVNRVARSGRDWKRGYRYPDCIPT